jgi:hypothetical protein
MSKYRVVEFTSSRGILFTQSDNIQEFDGDLKSLVDQLGYKKYTEALEEYQKEFDKEGYTVSEGGGPAMNMTETEEYILEFFSMATYRGAAVFGVGEDPEGAVVIPEGSPLFSLPANGGDSPRDGGSLHWEYCKDTVYEQFWAVGTQGRDSLIRLAKEHGQEIANLSPSGLEFEPTTLYTWNIEKNGFEIIETP